MADSLDAGRWRQVCALFDELVELAPAARNGRSRELGARDAALAAATLERCRARWLAAPDPAVRARASTQIALVGDTDKRSGRSDAALERFREVVALAEREATRPDGTRAPSQSVLAGKLRIATLLDDLERSAEAIPI
jgi:hypothetical protein